MRSSARAAFAFVRVRWDSTAASRALDPDFAALESAMLSAGTSEHETREIVRSAGAAGGDVVAGLLAVRLQRVLAAAGQTTASTSTHLVLRSRGAKEPGRLDAQIAAALAAIHARVGAAAAADPCVILAHPAVITRLRALLAPSAGFLAGVVQFVEALREESTTPAARARVEVLEAQALVDDLESRLPKTLVAAVAAAAGERRAPKREGALELGQLFHNKYRIVRRIGGGGFGVVYEALDERGVKNRVAIKILRSDATELGQEQLDAFRDEARRLTRLDHAHIVNWKSFDEAEDGTLYLVMELVDGQELDKLLKGAPGNRMPARRVQRVLLQILDALRAAHDVGDGESILHLDLKPNNVFVVTGRKGGDHVKLIDFGIGQYVGADASLRASGAPGSAAADAPLGTITLGKSVGRTVTVRGVRRVEACTPEYAAPEHCRHVLGDDDIVPLDGRADLYSLGVMAFQMLTGRLPYPSVESRYDIVRQHVVADAQRVSASGVRVPRDLGRFVDKLLARDRDARWKSADEAWRALQEIVSPPAWKTGLKMAAVVGLIAGVTAWLTWPDSRVPVKLWRVQESGELADLERDAVHLGPQVRTARIRLDAKDVDWNRYQDVPLRLASTSGTLEGWRVAWTGIGTPNEIAIEYVGNETGRIATSARIVGEIDDVWLEERPLRLVWLGSDSWSIARVLAGGTPLAESVTTAIDPEGLELVVEANGKELTDEDLAGIVWRFGDADAEQASAFRTGAKGSPIASIALPWPWDLPATTDVRIEVRDRAGRVRTAERRLDAVTTPLRAEVQLLDANSDPSEKERVCRRSEDGYLLNPRTRPVLAVEFNRAARPELKVTIGGSPVDLGKDVTWSATPEGVHRIDLASLLGHLTSGDSGSLAVEGRDLGVVRGAATGRGWIAATEPFLYSKDAASLVVEASGRELAPDDPWFTNAASIAFALRSSSGVAVVAKWRVHEPGATADVPWQTLAGRLMSQPGIPRLEFITVEPRSEGSYELEVQAFQSFGDATQLAADPDLHQRFPFVVSRTAPTLAWRGLAAGTTISAIDGSDVALAADMSSPGSGAAVSEIAWRLERNGTQVGSGALAPDAELKLATLVGSGDDVDGRYRIVANGKDAAGNAIPEFATMFDVAMTGPRFDAPSRPLSGSPWDREARGWPIRVEVADPNEVDLETISATIQGKDDAGGELKLEVPLLRKAGSPAKARVATVEGFAMFDDAWSSRSVVMTLTASDAFGRKRTLTVPDLQVGDARVQLHDRVVPLSRGAQPLAMRRILGNHGSVYLFGGQGDDKESEIFRRAKLGDFKEGRGERSFKVDYAVGVIADFYLDEDEVSCGEFLAFVQAGAQGYLDASHWPPGARPDPARHAQWLATTPAEPSLPITDVQWNEAWAYARWMGKRLPSLVEWEYAVRGGARNYRPYSAWTAGTTRTARELVNFRGVDASVTTAPWKRGAGLDVTSEGLRNLSGNVREWTSTPRYLPGSAEREPRVLVSTFPQLWFDPTSLGSRTSDATHFYAAGASWDSKYCDFLTWSSLARADAKPNVGFRCAISATTVRSGLGSLWGVAP